MKRFTNAQAFTYYRRRVADHLKTHNAEFLAQFADGDIAVALIFIPIWFGRYAARGGAIGGVGAFGAMPLEDQSASALLIARNRALDAAEPIVADWQSKSVRDTIARCAATLRAAGQAIDLSAAEDPHGYGPSIRRLWAEAKRTGLADEEAWEHVKDWALHRPKLAAAPALTPDLAERLARAVRWDKADGRDFAWAARAEAEQWRIRLNDFPEECMYGLWVGETCIGVFNDWPEAWERDGAARKAKPKQVAAPPVTGTAADRWLDRYVAGEHAAVWAEMVSLGPQIRAKPTFAPAWSVAQETMRRARHNVEQIIRRLDALDYRFLPPKQHPWLEKGDATPVTFALNGPQGMKPVTMNVGDMRKRFMDADLSRLPPQARKSLEQIQQSLAPMLGQFQQRMADAGALAKSKKAVTNHLEDADVFLPPEPEDAKILSKLERQKLYLPLSLRAWIEMVGRLDLNGSHPALCFLAGPDFPEIFADPLAVIPTAEWVADALEGWREEGADADDPHALFISFLDTDKARLNSAEEEIDVGYEIAIPHGAADAPLLGERHEANFVDYLRLAFRHGGFPGWERYGKRPEKELAFLTDGLLPI